MANNTITETLRFKFNTIARDQSDATFLDWRDLDLGTRADSNMQKLDAELYKILKRGLFIANTTTPSANQYVVSNSAIVEMFDKMALLLIPNADNTNTTTLQINSFVSSPIKKVSNNTYIDIVAGDLKSKQPTLIYYDLNSNVFVLASALVQSASTTQSGIVQLSNDTNSTDETKAVTPKALKTVADAKLDANQKGVANGVASLDTEGKVSLTQIPSSILGSLKYIGTWDASGGTTPSNPSNGNYWVISVTGVIDTVEYNVKDWLIYNASTWSKLDGEDSIEFATQTEAETGTNTTKVMSPLRVFQSIAKWVSDTTVSALTTTAKTIVGSINELSNKIGILSNLTTTEKSNLVSAITEVNTSLTWDGIHNTDFRSAYTINQRVVSGTISTLGYFIDRWKLTSGTVTLTANGLTLNGTISQIMEKGVSTTTLPYLGMYSGTATASYDSGTKTLSITSSGGTVTYVNKIKDYENELNECKRFYQRHKIDTLGTGVTFSTTGIIVPCLLTPSMRIAPSLSISGTAIFRVSGTAYTQSTAAVDAYNLTNEGGRLVYLNFATFTSTGLAAMPYNGASLTYVEFSADL